jgi:hypothetical protein
LLAGTPQIPPQPFSGARTQFPSSRVILSVSGICCAASLGGTAMTTATAITVNVRLAVRMVER